MVLPPLFVGTVAENCTDAPNDLAVLIGKKASCLTIFKCRVFGRIPIIYVVPEKARDVVRFIFIELIGVVNKAASVALC